MVRGKTQIKRIENTSSRQVAFSKRRNGILKKAFELSVLCDAEVALIIFSPTGKLFEFASTGTSKTIERYQKHLKEFHASNGRPTGENLQSLMEELATLQKKIRHLDASKRKLSGDELEGCSVEELQNLETQLEKGLSNIRARKNLLSKEWLQKLRQREKSLMEENSKLKEKLVFLPVDEHREPQRKEMTDEVETDLLIGWPGRRSST